MHYLTAFNMLRNMFEGVFYIIFGKKKHIQIPHVR